MKTVLLECRDLSKSFGNNGEQNHVLSNVNLKIYEKDFTIIMGSSGSGKSTLLYCLSGMDKPTRGKVFYQSKNIVEHKEKDIANLRKGEFGFVFQQMHLVSNLTLLENVVVPGYLNKAIKVKDVNEKAKVLLERFGLNNIKNHLPSQASGGENQRAAIARALINNPKLLFGDEPTGALNRKNGDEVLNLFTSINENGQSVLMVTHDVKAAIRGNRLLYLEDGKIIGELNLPPYKDSEFKSRETQVMAWLSSMLW